MMKISLTLRSTPKSNGSGNIEKDELLVTPGDVSFKQVTSCKTGPKSSCIDIFQFWRKEFVLVTNVGDDEELSKLTTKDKSILDKVNKLISSSGEEDEQEAKEETEE